MLEIKLISGRNCKIILTSERTLSMRELWENLEQKGFSRDYFYILQNGRSLLNHDSPIQGQGEIIPRVLGGKGGFGSMLRAIGAQIEKTTNREACRDLSGRRLRDINEEKRLKAWIEKQSSRKEEQAEKKKKKLERLCAEPKHEFQDKNYERERSILTERIDDAVEEGFKTAAAAAAAVVANAEEKKIEGEKKGIKRKTLLDEFDDEIDSDELNSDSDDEASSEPKQKILKGGGHLESSCDKNSMEKGEGKSTESEENR